MKIKKIFSLLLAFSVITPMNLVTTKASEDDGIIFSEDFENMEIGSFPSKISGQAVTYYQSASNSPQNVFEIQEDEFGSKAMKFIVNTKTTNTSTTFSIPIGQNLRSGTYEFSFDMRAEHDSRYFSRFFQLWNEKSQSEIWGETAVGYIYPLGRSNQPSAAFNMGGYDKESYFRVKFVFNMNTRKYKAYVNDKQIGPETSLPRAVNSAECGISQIVLYVNNGNYNGKANDGTDVNPGIYWVDNIMIKKNMAEVIDKYPEKDSLDADPEKAAGITLDYDFDESTVTGENVEVYEDDVKLDREEYTVSSDKNKLTVEKACGGFDYNKKYVIKFSDKIAIAGKMADIKPGSLDMEFTTQSVIPDALKDGGKYNSGHKIVIPEKENISYSVFIITDEEEKEYSGGELEIGEYKVKIKAENTKNGKREEKTYSIEVVGPFAPTAENVRIEGAAGTGEVLTGTFEYNDVNGDLPGEHEYVWFKSKNPDKGFEEITGANKSTYTLTEEDENCYIKFGVVPVSTVEPLKGDMVYSEVFTGSFSPVANNLKIDGTVKPGETLTGSYEYFDENGDTEKGTEFLWVKDSDIDGEFSEALKNQNGKTCMITEEDTDCYIKFAVIPKNDGKSKQENKFYSESILSPFSAVAKEVKIIGEAKVGQTLGASYSFYDANGDKEGRSKIKWYVGGEKVSERETLYLEESYKGKNVYFTVIPVSESFPYDGIESKSETVTVAAKKKVTYGGGGGSTGGGVSAITPAPDQNAENNKPEEEIKEKVTFSDISGHWAESTILDLAGKEIINGLGDGSFNPDGKITRAQLAMIISKIVDGETASCEFTDVPETAWYYNAVSEVNTLGIMKGDGYNFRPDDYVKREEIAVVMSNVLKMNNIIEASEDITLTDLEDISDWAKESVLNCMNKGIVTGYKDGSFGAKKEATRAEITVMTERLLNVLEGENDE